jgi:hypothetical protein
MLGKKYDHGKPDYSLMPVLAEEAVIKVLTFGANKYGRENWKLVEDAVNRYTAATKRHMAAIQKGEKLDPESGIHHYAHAICSLLFLLELELENSKEKGA